LAYASGTTSERGTNTSERSTNTSERSTNTSERGTNTSERGTNTSERGTNPCRHASIAIPERSKHLAKLRRGYTNYAPQLRIGQATLHKL